MILTTGAVLKSGICYLETGYFRNIYPKIYWVVGTLATEIISVFPFCLLIANEHIYEYMHTQHKLRSISSKYNLDSTEFS